MEHRTLILPPSVPETKPPASLQSTDEVSGCVVAAVVAVVLDVARDDVVDDADDFVVET